MRSRGDDAAPVAITRLLVCFILLGSLVVPECRAYAQASAQQPAEAPPIATPAIDETLFKDGALQSREAKFEARYAKCQEIVKIKRRICNLLSSLNDKDGNAQGSVLVATTDTGAPAMMIAIAAPLRKGQLINLKSNYITKVENKVVKVAYSHSAAPNICDGSCKFIIPLDPKLTFILNSGVALTVEVPMVASLDQLQTSKNKKEAFVSLTISGEGFAAALKASTEGW